MTYQSTQLKFQSSDIRFTTKSEVLYAIALGWPAEGNILIKSLAEGSENFPRRIRQVELLGAKSDLQWTRGTDGLEIRVPGAPPCQYAFSFRILAG